LVELLVPPSTVKNLFFIYELVTGVYAMRFTKEQQLLITIVK